MEKASKGAPAVKRVVESKGLNEAGKAVKRSDSLTKDEKTESNTKMRQMGNSAGQRTRRFVQRTGESGQKRRHTVGGTRDFDKVRLFLLFLLKRIQFVAI